MSPDQRERTLTVGLFAALLAFNVWGISVGWNNGFLPGNEYRQTHTAITTLFIQREDNFSLAYPTPLLGKPWSIPYEFPLYQWSVVQLANHTGLSLTQSARAVSATCFYLMLPAVWLLLARLGVTRIRRLVVLGLVLSCPLYIFYARAFLIETMALMFSLWFLAAFVNAVERRHLGWLVLANVAGAGAGLVKVTTFLLYLLPAGAGTIIWLWRARPGRDAFRDHWSPFLRTAGWIAAATAGPFAVTLAWIKYADGLKALNLSGRNLMSGAMQSYHFGTWQTRLSPALWRSFGTTLVTNIAPLCTLLLLAGLLAVTGGGRWRKWISCCLLLFAAGPLIFPLLYSWHEYYFVANSVPLLVAAGLTLCALLESTRPRWLVWSALLAVQASQIWCYRQQLYPVQQVVNQGGSGLTAWLHAITGPDDVLVIAGEDWAPMVPYYAQRRALMIREGMDADWSYIPRAFDALEGERVTVLLLRGRTRDNATLRQMARTEFGLEAEPVATWEDVTVWAHPSLRPRIIQQTHAVAYGGVKLVGQAFEEYAAMDFPEQTTASLPDSQRHLFDAMSPRPVRFAARYPLALMELDHRNVLLAHPDSRLIFALPAGRHRLTADYGILPEAYKNVTLPEVAPEGVNFSILLLKTGGAREVVFNRLLNPRDLAAHRGPQRLELSVQINPGDDLVFVTAPGPHRAYNRNWSYWTSIQIQ
jgi:hypothetical protein